MKKKSSFSVLSLVAFLTLSSAFAQTKGLTLPGEKWIAKFDKFVCAAYGPAVARPQALEQFKVNFEQLTTDSSLDNGLIKVNFEVNGATCNYHAIILADNAAQSMTLVQSVAFLATEVQSANDEVCNAGKELLDQALHSNKYLYYGHPHNVAIMMPAVGAESVCGAGAEFAGANFLTKGRVAPARP